MVTWAPPLDADLAAGKPGKPSQIKAIRDLSEALAQRASGAPWLNGIGAVDFLKGFGPILGTGERALVGTWTVPDGVYRIRATVVGGGGAGGAGSTVSGTSKLCGGGGGGGASLTLVIDVSPGAVFSAIVGAGGNPAAISPYVDTGLDSFVLGDGGRTTFGTIAAAGGKIGHAGSSDSLGGDGGAIIEGQTPAVIRGGSGSPGLHTNPFGADTRKSGSGGASIMGWGAPGRSSAGAGHAAGVLGAYGLVGVPGSGGGGGNPLDGSSVPQPGGRGANGIIIVEF